VTDLRSQAHRHNERLRRRLDSLVPALLDETGVDAWVLLAREYAEDPVLASMLPAEWLSARRLTVLVLTKDQRFAVTRYPVGDLFPSAWDPEEEPDQWRRLAALLREIDPATIGTGTNPTQAHSDGLTATLRDRLLTELPDDLASRIVSAGELGVRWLETRLPDERAILAQAAAKAHDILRRGLSREAIEPGTTTTDDLVWWYRQTVHDLGLGTWFHPSVSVQRHGAPDSVIRPGDFVHVDFGIVWEGLCTDQQEHAYVLTPGEGDAPEGLRRGITRANRVQDILMSEFVTGRTGNEILASALSAAADEGLDATIYTHSIGVHGHGAGMTIGMWDQQSGVPGAGDHRLQANTAYAIELSNASVVPEWGGARVSFMLEQNGWFDGEACEWLDGRQTELWLI